MFLYDNPDNCLNVSAAKGQTTVADDWRPVRHRLCYRRHMDNGRLAAKESHQIYVRSRYTSEDTKNVTLINQNRSKSGPASSFST